MIEIGGKPILCHIMKFQKVHSTYEYAACCGQMQHVIWKYFANYFVHNSDATLDLSSNKMEIHVRCAEPRAN